MTSQSCHTILGHLEAYLDGELETTECQAIEAHCTGCTSCAAVVAELRETIGLCRQVASVPLPEPVRARALERVRRLLNG